MNRLTASATAFVICMNIYAGTGPEKYNIVWDSPSMDANGTMPLGNGETGINVWFEPSGDLIFYVSRTDSWGDNGRLLKVGKIRVKFDPAVYESGFEFSQELDLATASVKINTKAASKQSGQADLSSRVSIWVDANNPVINIENESSVPVKMTAQIELWRTNQYELPSIECSDVMLDRSKPDQKHAPTIVEPDCLVQDLPGKVGWYHHNIKSVGPEMTAGIQGLSGFKRDDPLLHRTFGAVITGSDVTRIDNSTIFTLPAKNNRLSVYVATKHPSSQEEWLKDISGVIERVEKTSFNRRKKAHEEWWSEFWEKSYIHLVQGKKQADSRIIPDNSHPIKIGQDQGGGNRYKGRIARVSIFSRALKAGEVETLAVSDKSELKGMDGLVKSTADPGAGSDLVGTEFTGISSNDIAGSVTLEAWIQSDGGIARIIDMITPGGSDGFLLDTHPGNSLRFIVGSQIISVKNCLSPGKWSHVAAVADSKSGTLSLYLDGKLIAGVAGESGDNTYVVSRAYALQRFIDACGGRGSYPIKYNGSIFTVPNAGSPGDADYRRWGPGYWWQNTRLPYFSMCASGDFQMMQPMFQMYARDLRDLHRYRTKVQCGHDGIYIPECIYFWGDHFSETYGWKPIEERGDDKIQASGWHKWEWVSGPELVFIMFDYYDYTMDEVFLEQDLLPMAQEIIRFFDNHYKTDDKGKLVMHPAMACETWWDCTNPMPELAGLHAITRRLLGLSEELTTEEQRSYWAGFEGKLPPLPTREVDGVRAYAPAEIFKVHNNCENPELYCVFPFRLCSFEKDNVELGKMALKHRWHKGASGWRQDDIFMAYLGLPDQTMDNLVSRSRNYHKESRFPAFWGPNYDWTPDQTHGGVMMKTLQAMILQPDPYSRKIYINPALPNGWNCEFKLKAPYKTTIEGVIENGEVKKLKVLPRSRREDVVELK